ncbi:hypothetical protein CABS02_13895 [Colletotrichum abscissum]|uniref:Uncharacterized protein n=1 Tax=Colletotrichum abscissum TaxID=1671311 RepID=A0A9P9X2G0_9PEZI|nr:hypothetical protein CABS02_13895 [Colletotrichum abscissum]
MEADGATAPMKRRKDNRARRIPPIIAKVEKIGSPETLVRLWDSSRASRAREQSIVSGTRQILPVEPEGNMDGLSVPERLDSLKEQAAVRSLAGHFGIVGVGPVGFKMKPERRTMVYRPRTLNSK